MAIEEAENEIPVSPYSQLGLSGTEIVRAIVKLCSHMGERWTG